MEKGTIRVPCVAVISKKIIMCVTCSCARLLSVWGFEKVVSKVSTTKAVMSPLETMNSMIKDR